MASTIISTSISIAISVSTSFSTIFQTSRPVIVSTLTSVNSQLTTITKPEVVQISTIALPTTMSQTLSNVLTSVAPASMSLSPSPETVYRTSTVTTTFTSTISSTYSLPGETITYYPPTYQLTRTEPNTYTYTLSPPTPLTSTVTLTELIFILDNAFGQPYTSITTKVPLSPTSTDRIVFVPGTPSSDGWSSWSDAQRGGLIAGVAILFLLLLALFVWLILRRRRRNLWLANDWRSHHPTAVAPSTPMTNYVVSPWDVQRAQQGAERTQQAYMYWPFGGRRWGMGW